MSPESSSSTGSGGDGPRAAPRGLFDLQVNGFAGIDFQQAEVTAEEMSHAVQALHGHGTDRILLTLITDKIDALCAKLERMERHRRNSPAVAATVDNPDQRICDDVTEFAESSVALAIGVVSWS